MGLFATLSHTQKVSKTAISCQNNTKAVPRNRAAGRGLEKKKRFLDSHRYRRSDELRNKGWNFNLGGAHRIHFIQTYDSRSKQPRRGDSSARHNSERHESRRATRRESFAACRGRARNHPSARRQAIRAADKLERHV